MKRLNQPAFAEDKPLVLAFDPSFTAWGWAVVTKDHMVVKTGVIRTAPSDKKLKLRQGDDRVRRIQEIVHQIQLILKNFPAIKLIVSELPHGSQNARAAIMMGMVAGVVQTFCTLKDIPIEWYSEADAKKALFQRISASKREVIDAINALYEVQWTGVKYMDEAIADALAIYYCAETNSQLLKML